MIRSSLKWLVGLLCLGAVILLQQQHISRLASEIDILRAGDLDRLKEIRQANSALSEELEKIRQQQTQLLALRASVDQRRMATQAPATDPGPRSTAPGAPVSEPSQSAETPLRELGLAAARGDVSALDKLVDLASIAHARFRTNQDSTVFAPFRAAFDELASAAGAGNPAALQALLHAARLKYLTGFAVQALGEAAGRGSEQALEPLLSPEQHLLLLSSTVSALRPAAEAGNPRAVQALADVATNAKHQGLWHMAAGGLATAASGGNPVAVGALSHLAANGNEGVRKEAVQALEMAVAKQQPLALQALQKLGWRQ